MFLAVVIAVIVIVGVTVLGYNSLQRADQGVRRDFSNIVTELDRRATLIPNLVATVRRYAAHERKVFERVAAARAGVAGIPRDPANADELAQAQAGLTSALHGLYAVAENYPQLQSSQNFLALQAELTDTDDRLAASRKLYNSSVDHLNSLRRTFPTLLLVPFAGVNAAEYYTLPESRLDELNAGVDVRGLF